MIVKQKSKSINKEAMLLLRPPINRIAPNSITKNAPLKKDLFKFALPVAAARMQPNLIGAFVKQYAKECFTLYTYADVSDVWSAGRIRHILENGQTKLVIMNPRVSPESSPIWNTCHLTVDANTLSEKARSYIQEKGISLQPHTLILDYDVWTAGIFHLFKVDPDEILAATLPPNLEEIPTGFTVVGHIAHMNLRAALLPYKYHIGSVILSKNANQGITTVVNKVDTIDSIYRNFQMEVIAGEEKFQVTQHHLDCMFSFDFSKVYWNTRLENEHRRLVEMFSPGEGVCDVFAGVGPFAIPAGRRHVFVLANDLNPDSYVSMEGNIKANKVSIICLKG